MCAVYANVSYHMYHHITQHLASVPSSSTCFHAEGLFLTPMTNRHIAEASYLLAGLNQRHASCAAMPLDAAQHHCGRHDQVPRLCWPLHCVHRHQEGCKRANCIPFRELRSYGIAWRHSSGLYLATAQQNALCCTLGMLFRALALTH